MFYLRKCQIWYLRYLLNFHIEYEILEEYHWHLALQAREMSRITANKTYERDWIIDRTGLYESASEIRKTDIESDIKAGDKKEDIITIAI